MEVGNVLGGRWTLLEEAGRGGMGVVFRAMDGGTGAQVAVKVLLGSVGERAARFDREVELLAELRHPSIVRYLGHGVTDGGERFLVMEWLDGCTLTQFLRTNRLPLQGAIAVVRQVAAALGRAHEQGVVHRDVKPANIVLEGADPGRVRLLDFGIARIAGAEGLTRTGHRVGTPSYMSPEQARGADDLDARSDVFSLGVVLYQCLTRRRPFWSGDPLVTLSKVLTHDPPPVSRFAPGVPDELDHLVHRMLDKDAHGRLADGNAVVHALDALSLGPSSAPVAIDALTDDEQRLQCVVSAVVRPERVAVVEEQASRFGAKIEASRGGTLVLVLSSAGAATDLAVRGAQLALAIRGRAPAANLSVAMVLGGSTSGSSSGRLGGLIGELPTAVYSASGSPVRIDPLCADLVGERFEVGRDASGPVLRGLSDWTPRTLLGHQTRCVARDAELAILQALFEAAADEPMARAALVTAPAGVGKSRLKHEFLARLRRSGEEVTVLTGQGDALRTGVPYGLVASALRASAGIVEGRADSAARLRERVGADAFPWLAELAGLPVSEPDVQLAAARRDPQLMADRIASAFESWLRAETALQPVVFVLEDLHWGDAPTVRLLDRALRNLSDRPWLVLALGRPEVETRFARLFADRELQHLRLGPIRDRAARRLVRDVLGSDASTEIVDGIVARAAGNALYLEELIRDVAAGARRNLPDTVLAMVQARLESMEPEARRVLRAGSVFGRSFWVEAVAALLGASDVEPTRRWVDLLADREVVAVLPGARLAGQTEVRFRHDLVRDGAYAMLTPGDRATGHRIAAAWLHAQGEREAEVLAEHYDLGEVPSRAAAWYLEAARASLDGNDFDACVARLERGLELASDALIRGRMLGLLTEAHVWRGSFADAAEAGHRALELLGAGSPEWFSTVAELATACGVAGDADTLVALAGQVAQQPVDPGTAEAHVLAASRVIEQGIIVGRLDACGALLELLDSVEDHVSGSPSTAGRIHSTRALHACFVGDAEGNLRHVDAAVACFERAGDVRNTATKQERAGYTRLDLGAYAEAEAMLRSALEAAERVQLANVVATAKHNLGLTLSRLGAHGEAVAVETEAAELFALSGNRRMQGASMEYLALIELEGGRLEEAERAAREAIRLAEEPTLLPLNRAESLAILARVLLAAGRSDRALIVASEAADMLASLGGIDDGEAIIRLTLAEALRATGRHDEAREALTRAVSRLRARAGRMSEELRETFLNQVPENRRTLELARAWGTG